MRPQVELETKTFKPNAEYIVYKDHTPRIVIQTTYELKALIEEHADDLNMSITSFVTQAIRFALSNTEDAQQYRNKGTY